MGVDYLQWIRDGLRQTGKTQVGLARHLGLTHPQITRLLKGVRRLKVDELPRIADYLGVCLPGEGDTSPPGHASGIPVLGEVAAGIWLEIMTEPERFEDVPVTPSPSHPANAQYGLIVRGESLNKIAKNGDTLHCVSVQQTNMDVKDGDLVIVERVDASGKRETTAKRLRRNGHFELWPESDHPAHQKPIIVPNDPHEMNEEISVIAKVIGLYREI